MKNDAEKYIARRKRMDKAFAKDFESGYAKMKTKLFNELLASVKQARAIERGEKKPSRVFGKAANKLTARTLKASMTGRNVKRFSTKKALLADLGL